MNMILTVSSLVKSKWLFWKYCRSPILQVKPLGKQITQVKFQVTGNQISNVQQLCIPLRQTFLGNVDTV